MGHNQQTCNCIFSRECIERAIVGVHAAVLINRLLENQSPDHVKMNIEMADRERFVTTVKMDGMGKRYRRIHC